jgi:hypothetical protein
VDARAASALRSARAAERKTGAPMSSPKEHADNLQAAAAAACVSPIGGNVLVGTAKRRFSYKPIKTLDGS